ncbi:hypothetical protein EDD22DRAFT_231338 [Suillus occidentalis]|nr:hypothetical protein EDD22DRAFT_231338 [Suillus occidentalis]
MSWLAWAGVVLYSYGTQSHQPLSNQSFGLEDRVDVTCVSFSRDGRYLAYGGADKSITLWTMKEIVGIEQGAQQGHTETQSQSSSCLDFDATNPLARSCGNDITEDGHDDLYSNFFQGSRPYLPETSSIRPQFPYLSLARRFWNARIMSRHIPQRNKSILQEPPKCSLSHSHSPMQLATTTTNQLLPEVNSQGEQTEDRDQDISLVDREESPADAHTAPPDISNSLAKLKSKENSGLWNVLTRARGKSGKRVQLKTHSPFPEVVEVYAVRGFQRLVVTKRIHKKQSRAVTHCAPPAVASNLSQAGPSRGSTTQACTSSQAIPRQSESSSQSISQHGNQISHAPGDLSLHTSPPRFVTTNHTDGADSDSGSSIQGSCNKFLDKIYFPRGHYHNDS